MRSRVRFLAALVAVAFGAAFFAVSFRLGLSWWYRSAFDADNVVTAMAAMPWWLRLTVPVAGALAAGLVARWRKPASQGVSNVMEAVVLGNVTLSMRATASRVTSSALAIASGFSIGREGPLIEFGGSLAAAVARRTGLSLNDTRVLVASGTAAGFAAAYNTPFAAVLFVFETIIGIATPAAVLPTMAATVVATLVTRSLVGEGPIYGLRTFQVSAMGDLWWLLVLGGIAAIVAVAFKMFLARAEGVFERLALAQPWRAIAGGVVVGMLVIGLPDVSGNGFEPLNQILNREYLTSTIAWLLVAKIVATSVSVASGVPGGIFTPMLLAGAATGWLWAQLIASLSSYAPDVGAYALVGMAAITAASIHAPLTAAVLVFELSADYAMVLPLILATVVATSLSRALGSESIYESELRRRGLGWELTLEGRHMAKRNDTGAG
ncbi:MAG TPA: chloride channel protein [Vicinamibacterales bacterium]|jgi:CIC family chloride channel protein